MKYTIACYNVHELTDSWVGSM